MEVRAGTGSPAAGGGRWDNVTRDKGFKSQTSGSNTKEEGVILLITDPGGAFSITFGGKKGLRSRSNSCVSVNEGKKQQFRARSGSCSVVSERFGTDIAEKLTLTALTLTLKEGEDSKPANDEDDQQKKANDDNGANDEAKESTTPPVAAVAEPVVISAIGKHVKYRTSSIASTSSQRGGHGGSHGSHGAAGPKRGDLVTFVRSGKPGSGGVMMVKDIRSERGGGASSVRGRLSDICIGSNGDSNGDNSNSNTAIFLVSPSTSSGQGKNKKNDGGGETKKYRIQLSEVVSCNPSLLKEDDQVDGILHEGKVYGVCRTKDLYLGSSFGRNAGGGSAGGGTPKERPRLNLTVKKELQGMGGKIMAQTGMAKGPDGTNGFAPGWTARLSPHVSAFVPSFTIETNESEGGDGDDNNGTEDMEESEGQGQVGKSADTQQEQKA